MADVPTNKEQNEVSGRILEGHHVLITGQAGSGKTQTLKSVFKDLKFLQKDVALLCTTGMGCLQFIDLGATTVHRYSIFSCEFYLPQITSMPQDFLACFVSVSEHTRYKEENYITLLCFMHVV